MRSNTFFSYWDNEFEGKAPQSQLLFHMATGSGKTLIMGGIILYLYEQGYRNFLFFVNSGNVIEKTKDNFFNTASSKYLFNQSITINNKRVEIKQVDNFQDSDPDAINFCLQTIQGLHGDLNTPKENGVTYDDFKNIKVVLIADEAHHINTATKSGSSDMTPSLFNDAKLEDLDPSDDWETTVMRIFRANPANVLLEFTATEDFANANIADKYKDKVIFDYPLKKFREDGYSKDIAVLQSDMQPIDRAIQAVIMSQFRRKLGNQIRQDIKPVVMLKSKTIKANKEFFDEFVETIKHLNVDTLSRIKSNAKDGVFDAFKYFEAQEITLENLLLEIQEDFKEDNLLLVDGSSISAEKQQYLNSLEDKDNEFRAVFAVDMLNEGWDVLNLFDIVRLYDTRDARSGTVGATTNSEAQLIGRGARYLPFTDKAETTTQTSNTESSSEPTGAHEGAVVYGTPKPRSEYATKRKFDEDLNNPLRHLETLSYHSAHNPRYIQELNSALAQTGIIDSQSTTVVEKLKDSFKKTRLYTEGYVFANEQEVYLINEDLTNIGENILTNDYPVKISTGEIITSKIFSKATTTESANVRSRKFKLKDFGKHVLRAAINKFDGLKFQELHEIFPNLESIKQFIESPDYLANINVTVYGREDILDNLTQKDKLFIVVEVLREIEPKLTRGGIGTRGSKKFIPKQVRDVFHDHVYKVSKGVNKEDGVSMKETTNPFLRYDLSTADWYGYEDNFGTEEEKYLIRYIESIENKLREKYDEVYLLRNYKKLKIYAFKDGAPTEPDFVLFLRKKGTESEYDNIQIFIEPKGSHLRKNDAWKEEFELSIHDEAFLTFQTANDRFEVWGMPFYTHSHQSHFSNVMSANFL
ncbi:MAG: DEAD/DEAH box helicase family protein [Muribaculaceae bacterium]|nr:DEAD/DEAH box helicase family protein [Muribaculaceae bacterium]